VNTTSIADEIYRELDQPSDLSIPSIAFWLQTNIGQLNLKTGLAVSVSLGVLSETLSDEAAAIYKALFKIHYLKRKINQNLGAAAYSSIAEVKEGNRTVKRTNKNDIAKSYIIMKESEERELNRLISAYKQNLFSGDGYYTPNPILTELPEVSELSEERGD
jgi:hypothetical protein